MTGAWVQLLVHSALGKTKTLYLQTTTVHFEYSINSHIPHTVINISSSVKIGRGSQG